MTTAFPNGGRDIIDRMIAKFPELFVNVDETQRELTRRINQQFAYQFGTKWGGKKRTGLSDDFQSKDSQAVQESNGTTSVWDMFSSSLQILVQDGDPPTHPNLSPSEATFMPMIPRDWLAGSTPPPVEPPPDDGELEARVAALEIAVVALEDRDAVHTEQIKQLTDRVAELERIVSLPMKVSGATGTRYGHGHTVNLEVQR
jgi:hypothetical protein